LREVPYSCYSDHVRLTVRLTPGASRDGIEGFATLADGECVLKARVSAIAEAGKANQALVALLAKSLRHPKSAISIISGETARKKILRIEGDPEDVSAKLLALGAG
jgi:uncharacterized protein (TIGR00251 family)